MLVVAVADVLRRRDVIVRALAGGIDTVHLRDRDAGGKSLFDAALIVRELTRDAGALLIVNDRADVAVCAHADGVHLPAAGLPTARARAIVGDTVLIGRSTHAPEEARTASTDGADYVVLGPIFATPSKAAYGPPLGLEPITRARPSAPIIAIGGIGAAEAAAVHSAGADGVAVVRAILDAGDPEAAARTLVAAVRDAQARPGAL